MPFLRSSQLYIDVLRTINILNDWLELSYDWIYNCPQRFGHICFTVSTTILTDRHKSRQLEILSLEARKILASPQTHEWYIIIRINKTVWYQEDSRTYLKPLCITV